MKFDEFSYKNAKQRDSVVVVAGGPSSSSNRDFLIKYIENNNSIVYSANYNHFETHYTYIGDSRRFVKLIDTITSPRLIVSNWLFSRTRFALPNNSEKNASRIWRHCLKKHKVYQMGRGNKRDNLKIKKWKSLRGGKLDFTPSPSGFATLILSTMSKPKKILIAGLDGPVKDKDGRYFKTNFKGYTKRYRSARHFKMRQRILDTLAMPFIKRRGIQVETFKDSPLWGIDKQKFDICELF